jgi:hypothetical protein
VKLSTLITCVGLVVCLGMAEAQTVSVLPMSVQMLPVPASTSATYLNVVVDASPNGGDFIDVASPNSQLLISLIIPGGTEVTPSNASNLGFSVNQQVNTLSTINTSGVFTPFDSLGAHTTFILPAGSPGGTYQVKANSSNVGSPTSISVIYFSTSGPTAGVATDKVIYNLGDTVSLTAFVFNGSTQVTGATANATIVPPLNVSSQASIGNLQIVGQTASGGFTQYTCQASLVNTGNSGFALASAKLINIPASITLVDAGTLDFANVPAAGSIGSVNTFTVQLPSSQTFDPTTLSWNITAEGTPVSVALTDPGTGNYTGTYVPGVSGVYRVLVNISGTTNTGAYARTVTAIFKVIDPLAAFSAVTDTSVVNNGNGLVDQVVLAAQMNVITPGTYIFSATLKASNGQTTTASGMATLPTGSGQINAPIPATQLLQLGVNGPYEKIRASVSQVPSSGPPVLVGFIADAGPTSPYTLASVDRGPFYFTGQNSAAGVVTGAGPTFDLLQVSIGVHSNTAQSLCSWSGGLTDLSNNIIDFNSSTGSLNSGLNTITLNFNGNKIARAANGPYLVENVSVICGSQQVIAATLFETQAFNSSQFTSAATDFSLALLYNPSGEQQGSKFPFQFSVAFSGGFSGAINLSVSGLPSNASGTIGTPVLLIPVANMQMTVTTTGGTPVGSYPITITGTSGNISHSITGTLTVTAAPQVATPTFTPSAGGYTSAQSVTINTTTSGASIRYTTDGSTPSETTGTLYSGPITVSTMTTINAIAYERFMADSAVASATYTFSTFSVPPPSRPWGAVLDSNSPLATSLAGLFVMNESDGPADRNLVDGQAADFAGGGAPAWNTADPSIVFNGGSSLNSYLNAGTDLTFDQLTPNQMTIVSKVYVSTIAPVGVAEKNDGNTADSGFLFGWDGSGALRLTVEKSSANMLVATQSSVVPTGQWVQVAFTWDGTVGTAAAAHLFIDGVEQAKASSNDGGGTIGYANATSQPFRIGNGSFNPMTGSFNGKMAYLAVYKGRILTTSEMASIDAQLPLQVAGPTFGPAPGTYGLAQSVEISTVTSGASIRYTTDGTTPSETAGTLYTGPIAVSATDTIKAIAYWGGIIDSPVVTGSYTIEPAVSAPAFSPGAGTYSSAQTVTLSTATSGASIRYTLDGSTPSETAGTLYSGPITVSATTTINAIAYESGTTDSPVASATFVIGTAPPARPVSAVLNPTNPLSTNLAGLFVLNEATGTTDQNLVDGQTASFAGTGAPTWNTSDPSVVFGGGASLSSYLNAGTDLIFDQLTPHRMTIIAKVYANSIAPAGIAEKNDGNSIDSGFLFGWDGNGALRLTVEKSSTNMLVATQSNAVPSGQWVQVAFTWDGTVGNSSGAQLFINGAAQTLATANDGSGTLGYANATNQPFRIGNGSFNPMTGSLNGKIAYVAVYNGRLLTPAEMASLDAQLPIASPTTPDVFGSIVEGGAPVTATTSVAGQNDRLSFLGSPEQKLTVQLTGNTMGSTTIAILNPDRSVLSSFTSSASTFSLPATELLNYGVHTIYVQPGAPGNINVSLTETAVLPARAVGAVLHTTNPLATNLAGLFLMNEGSGGTDQDLVDGQAANFAGTNAPTWNTSDPSVVFSGGASLDSYLTAGADLTFDQLTPQQMTVVGKVYVTAIAPAGIAEKNDNNSADSGFAFGWDTNGALKLTVEKSTTNVQASTGPGVIPSGQWVQVAFTWDGTVGTASAAHLFINGVEQAKVSSNDGSGTIGYTNSTDQPFRLGNASFDVTAGSLNGKMAYLAVYKGRILTTAEMASLDAQLPVQ